jgi:hypothetical protein
MRFSFITLAAVTAVLAFAVLKPTLIDSTLTITETLDRLSVTTSR